MQEPKKYTAKEAMHWMIDHPGEAMFCFTVFGVGTSYKFDSGNARFEFRDFPREWQATNASYLGGGPPLYIKSEYDTWQAALKAEAEKAEDLEPREGESLYKYMKRDGGDYKKQSELEDSRQCWIESYVRREIAKALCGTVDVTVRETARATGERLDSVITDLLERVEQLEE